MPVVPKIPYGGAVGPTSNPLKIALRGSDRAGSLENAHWPVRCGPGPDPGTVARVTGLGAGPGTPQVWGVPRFGKVSPQPDRVQAGAQRL